MSSMEQPKLVSHCNMLFSRMDAEANADHIWQGKIIETCRQLGINVGSYSRVVNSLRTLGCIELLEKGYRSRPTIYRIHFPPTPEVWERNAPDRTEDLTSGPSSDTMAAAVRDLQQQIGGINIVEAFKNVEGRLQKLEQQARERQQEDLTARQQQS
jgi:hypothetical protein